MLIHHPYSSAEVSRVASEVDIVTRLLKAGCPLFSSTYSLDSHNSLQYATSHTPLSGAGTGSKSGSRCGSGIGPSLILDTRTGSGSGPRSGILSAAGSASSVKSHSGKGSSSGINIGIGPGSGSSFSDSPGSGSSSRFKLKEKRIRINTPTNNGFECYGSEIECADIAVRELSVTLLKTISRLLSSEECWRLILSSIIFYNDVNARMFCSILQGGISEIMLTHPITDMNTDNGQQILLSIDPLRINKSPKKNNFIDDIKIIEKSEKLFEISGKSEKEKIEKKDKIENKMGLIELENCYFNGYTVAGWAVRLGNVQIVENIISSGYNILKPADIFGNNLIHLGAKYGNKEMIDLLCCPKKYKIDFELLNFYGHTAIMEGSRNGNYVGVKQLLQYGGNARKGLQGKYCAWLLVLINIDEKEEKKKSERSEKKQPALPCKIADSDLIIISNNQNPKKIKLFVLNKFDIIVIRKMTIALLCNLKYEQFV